MTHVAIEDYIAEAIARTGVYRYRYLCLAHPDPTVRADYQRLIIEIAWVFRSLAITLTEDVGDRLDPSAEPRPTQPCCGGYNPMALDP